jgi:hypothetical protein
MNAAATGDAGAKAIAAADAGPGTAPRKPPPPPTLGAPVNPQH